MGRPLNPNIDYDVLPVDRPDSSAYTAAVNRVRAELAHDGCAVIHGVLTPAGLAATVAEADTVAPAAHQSFNRTNAYFTADDDSLPIDDPRRRFYDRSNAFVPADNFAAGGPLRGVYDEPGFDGLIRDCIQAEPFHRYADPLADVIINTAVEGPGFPWHWTASPIELSPSISPLVISRSSSAVTACIG